MCIRVISVVMLLAIAASTTAQMSVEEAQKRMREREIARWKREDDERRQQEVADEQSRARERQRAAAERERLARIRYHVIPIVGEIGTEILAADVAEAFNRAKRSGAQCVILLFDTGGGQISEKERLIAVLRRNRDIPTIAFVKKAFSAAAIVAMACEKIYMPVDGVIGATVSYQESAETGVKAVDAKFLAATKATDRAAATLGSHSTLFVDAMTDLDVELFITHEDRTPAVVSERRTMRDVQIKKRGEILAMTGKEAVAAGLAAEACNSLDELAVAIGLPPQRDEVGDEVAFMVGRIAANQKNEERRNYFAHFAKVLDELDRKIEAVRIQALAELRAADALKSEYQEKRAAAERAYRTALGRIDPRDSNALQQMGTLTSFHRQMLTDIDARYVPTLNRSYDRVDALIGSKRALEAEYQTIVDRAPR